MIRDDMLKFAASENLAGMLSLQGVIPLNFYALPNVPTLENKAWDLLTAQDKGDGYPLIARFNITTSFTATTDPALTLRWGVAIAADPLFSGGNQILCLGEAQVFAQLVAQNSYELTIPKLSTIHVTGQRWMFLGFVLVTNVVSPNPVFTTGAVEAHIMLAGQSMRAPPFAAPYPVGWSSA